jgi:PLP dependent protein
LSIAENIARIRERIAAAATRAGRDPVLIALMAVTKTVEPRRIREAHAAGLRLFGENRVQEFAEKINLLRDLDGTGFHLIGHLQTNKAAKAAEMFAAVDSLDSLRLADKLNQAAAKLKRKLDVLIEVNVGGEAAKTGVAPGSAEIEALLGAAPRLESLRFAGLMTVPPFTVDPEQARPHFRRLRELRDTLAARAPSGVELSELSMGMSHDFEVAIEEGATCVRVGTAIFGARTKP